MLRSILIACAALCAAPLAQAADADTWPNFAEETLTGDWNGSRTNTARNGYVWEASLRVDALRNRGAQSSGSKAISHLDLMLNVDLEKVAGWAGSSAMINVVSDAGWGPNARHVAGHMGVSSIEVADPTTTRLFQAWMQQSFLDGRLAVLAGLYPIDSEFFTMDSAGVFVGPQYGTPAELAMTRGPSVFNNSAFGVRARWDFAPTLYAMGAVLDGVPNDPAHPKRTAIRFAEGDGSFTIGELGWLPEATTEGFKGHAKFALGLWGYSAKVPDQLDTDAAGNPVLRKSQGGYLLGERTLARLGGEADRYLTGFARYTWGDGDSTPLKDSLTLGVHIKAPVASRPDDIVGLAWTRAGVAGKWRTAQAALGTATSSSEEVIELTYRYAVTPYLAIQPNYQYIRHPGGLADVPSARLIGARFDLAF